MRWPTYAAPTAHVQDAARKVPMPAFFTKLVDHLSRTRRAAALRDPLGQILWAYICSIAFVLFSLSVTIKIFLWANGRAELTVILAILIPALWNLQNNGSEATRRSRFLFAFLMQAFGKVHLAIKANHPEFNAKDLQSLDTRFGHQEYHLKRIRAIQFCARLTIEIICIYKLLGVIGAPYVPFI